MIISIMYKHGIGNILSFLNSSLYDILFWTLPINLTTLFCILKTFKPCESPPQKVIPYLKCEWKFAK